VSALLGLEQSRDTGRQTHQGTLSEFLDELTRKLSCEKGFPDLQEGPKAFFSGNGLFLKFRPQGFQTCRRDQKHFLVGKGYI
jgi:hypothetical protein